MVSNREILKNMIAYLPQNLVENLISNPEKEFISNSIDYDGTILYSDISGFTLMSEALTRIGREGAEEMSKILNNYYKSIEDIVRKHEGYIQRTAGDSTTIIFIKKKEENNLDISLKAIHCALNIQELIRNKFQYIETIAGVFKLAMKIGIALGKVFINSVGNANSGLKHIIYGEPIIDSANAESHASSGDILITKDVCDIVKHIIESDKISKYYKIRKTQELKKKYSYVKPIDILNIPDNQIDLIFEKIKYYLPQEIFNRIKLGQTGFLSEHRKITALFVNFSGLNHKFGNVGEQIQEYMITMHFIISKYGGRLQDYEGGDKGDKLLIYFGVPTNYENDEERALRCALDIIETGKNLYFIEKQHIGIATGYVYAGVVGYELYKTYTTIGDTVNVASRLMEYAISNNLPIILEKNTYERTYKKFNFEEYEPIKVKNRIQAIQIYQLKKHKKSLYKDYLNRKLNKVLAIVGRKKELELFDEKSIKINNSYGQVITISGEAGIGKTRLSIEFLSKLFKNNIKGYGADCLSYGVNTPYLVWSGVLKDFFEIDDSINEELNIKRIETLIEKVDKNFVTKLPIICNIIGLNIEDNEVTKHLDAKLKKENFFSIVLESLKFKAKENSIFLIIEDAHCIDSISLELLNYICRNISNEKILIIIVHRPLDANYIDKNFKEIFNYEYHTKIDLKYLEASETIELVNKKLNIENIPQNFKNLIINKSQGNPFFVEEILNSLIDNGFIKFNKSIQKYEILKDLSKIDMPDTIQDMILSRIDKLDESCKLTMKVASVIGRQFKVSMLREIYPEQVKKSTLVIKKLVNQDLSKLSALDLLKLDIPEPEMEYIFKHVITQEVSYTSLLFSHRRMLHEKIAKFLEETYPDKIDLIAYHYENTDNTLKKIEFFEKVAKIAENNYANQEAIEYYQKLINLIDREIEKSKINLIDNYNEKICNLWKSEKYNEIKKYITELEKLMTDVKNERIISDFNSILAKSYFSESKYDMALEKFNESLALNKKIDNKERIAVDLFNIGVIYFTIKDYKKSEEFINEALSVAKNTNLSLLIDSAEKAIKEISNVK